MPYPPKEIPENPEIAPELQFSIRKIFIIAMIMASMAGYINSAMLIEFGIPVSQMTGVASRLSDAIVHLELNDFINSFTILIGFLCGAFLSGLLIGRAQFKTTANYGHALLLNCAILATATLFSFIQSEISLFLSAIACGLQNALVASYRGLQLRTTHMTGTVTDIGVHLANKVKNKQPWPWQANLLLVLLFSFLIGGVLGIFAYWKFPNWSLIVPSLITGCLGLIYLKIYFHKANQATN
ncbi:YoaK family protein [Thiomicrorhabdus sp.]|uniref:YoaK family protein n=1 Tax=Thiomicrorhabdus sp. TaxID=2039724 RepID=UPI003569DA14